MSRRKSLGHYAGPTVEVRSDTSRLDTLLQDFCFKSPADRTNYIGMLLTALLIPRFVGSKPAALFNGNQPELGKSILAQIIATLRDGHPAETATYNPNDEEFEKRLGAIVRRGVTTIIIDNAKGRARNPRIESACLERSITDPILSFRLLGYSQEIRAENSHIFCITANTPDVSRDLVTRSAVINLYHEGDPERRLFSIADPEGYAEEHRLELLGELIGMVERWKASGMPKASVHSRFNKRGWRLQDLGDSGLALWFTMLVRWSVLLDQETAVQRCVHAPTPAEADRRNRLFTEIAAKMRVIDIPLPKSTSNPEYVCCAVYLVTGQDGEFNLSTDILPYAQFEPQVDGWPAESVIETQSYQLTYEHTKFVLATACPPGKTRQDVTFGLPRLDNSK